MQHHDEDDDWTPEPSTRGSGRKSKRVKTEEVGLAPGVAEGIEVKTKFPVARIKRIMQADEDVGKVAQVTPVAVCKSAFLTYKMSVISVKLNAMQRKHSSSS